MCLMSWKEIHPEFQIKRWDESNADLSHPYVQAAYAAKKWAFVADFVRFQVLVNEGGIYLDTDMLLLKPISEFLDSDGFIGFEDDKYVSAGIIGTVASQKLFQKVYSYYLGLTFDPVQPLLINLVLNQIATENGLVDFNKRQSICGVDFYPFAYFYPYSFAQSQKDKDYSKFVLPESYAVHLWDHSWGDEFSEFRKGNTLKGMQKVAAKIIQNPNQPKSYYKRVMKNVLKSSTRKSAKR